MRLKCFSSEESILKYQIIKLLKLEQQYMKSNDSLRKEYTSKKIDKLTLRLDKLYDGRK